MNSTLIFLVGIAAQALFSARLLVQWIKSEKAQKVLSPTLFWQLSLIASFLLVVYGVLRNDLVIIGGQCISYFVYIRNLRFKNAWRFLPTWFRAFAMAMPFLGVIWILWDGQFGLSYVMKNDNNIPVFLMIWGTAAQSVFSLRFIYQWWYSEKLKKSVLPTGFWIISLAGSIMIIIYGIFRMDLVIIIGQIFGAAIYARNLYLQHCSVKLVTKTEHG